MRKVLMIAYTFPPRGGSGVQRTLKFAKYLPEFGWQPVILTVSNPPLREADPSLLKELPGDSSVYRAPDFDMGFLRGAVKRLFSFDGRHSANVRFKSSGAVVAAPSRMQKAWASFVGTWFLIPDPCIRWLPAAVWGGLRIVKQCDVIYSTSAPFTDHIVAYLLHKLSGKPWVADFRDPWTQYVVYQHSSRLRGRIDAFLEGCILNGANLVTVTCAATAKGFQRTHPTLARDKFIEVTNGFDAEDFDRPPCPRSDRFTIVYAGRFHSEKNTSSFFLQTLRELRCRHPELALEIKVIFAGVFGDQNHTLVREWGLEEMVKPVGYVLHHESIRLLLESDVLLLTLSEGPGINLTYPGKLFEYLATRKTILALVPEGATAELIRDLDAGLVVPPDDVRAIYRAILGLYNQYKRDNLVPRTCDDLQRFERRTLTKRLACCLETVLQDRKGMAHQHSRDSA